MRTDYVVLHSETKNATIFQDNEKKGRLEKKDGIFELRSKGHFWTLTHRVDGELRPFSIICHMKSEDNPEGDGELCLKIRDNIFRHRDNFYSIGEVVPVGSSSGDVLSGSKFICRLVNFPFSGIESVDNETKHQMKRYRGIAVGEVYGFGANGYHAKIYGDDLSDIGLPLAAASYLIYTTR